MAKEEDQRGCPQQKRQGEAKKEAHPASAATVLSRHPALDGIAMAAVSSEEADFLLDARSAAKKNPQGEGLAPLRMG
jgi:hypothetical protein